MPDRPSPAAPPFAQRLTAAIWQALLETSDDGFWVVDARGRLLEINQAYCRLSGYPRETLLTMSIQEVEAVEDPAATAAHLAKVRHEGHDRFETRHRTRDNRLLDFEVSAIHVAGDDLFFAFLHDITALKQTQRALARSHGLTETLMQSANVIIVGTDRDGCIRLFNPGAEQVTGYSAAEVVGHNWFELFTPPARFPEVEQEFQRIMGGGAPRTFENPILTRGGEERFISWRNSVVCDSDSNLALLSLGIDITEKHRAEKELHASEHYLRQIIDNAPFGILRYYLDECDELRFEGGNPAAERILGLPLAPFVGHLILAVFPGLAETELPAHYACIARHGGEYRQGEMEYRTGAISGVYEFVAFQTAPRKMAVFFSDITARKLNEQELVRAREEALTANRAKDEFLGVMSHELRTPLTPIFGFSEILALQLENPAQREYLSHIEDAARRMLRLIDDLLSFTRLAHKPLTPRPAPFAPAVLFRRLLRRAETYSRGNRLRFEEGCGERAGIFPPQQLAVADGELIGQIVANLLTNACKFTHGGEVFLRVGLAAESDHGHQLRFEVEDNGIGIPGDRLATIWEPFTQVDASSTRAYEGVGLGLAICQRIATSLGGSIGVESRLGAGSRFWVSLPVSLVPASEAANGKHPPQETTLGHAGRGRVLVVEDNPMNRVTLEVQLRQCGVEAVTAEDGEIALEILRSEGPENYDLILMDLHLPALSGLETFQRLRELFPATSLPPVVALTADGSDPIRDQSRASGMADFLEKPVPLDRLRALLVTWLTR